MMWSSIAVLPRSTSIEFGLEPKDLVDEDDCDAPRHSVPVDDQHLVHGAVHAVRRLSSRILAAEGVVVDSAKSFFEVRHDLLRSDDEDHPTGTAYIRTELAATGRGRPQRSGLGYGFYAAEHHVGRRAQAAHFVALRLAIHAQKPRPEGLVLTG